MRAVVAVDWPDQSFSVVKVVCRLFTDVELPLLYVGGPPTIRKLGWP